MEGMQCNDSHSSLELADVLGIAWSAFFWGDQGGSWYPKYLVKDSTLHVPAQEGRVPVLTARLALFSCEGGRERWMGGTDGMASTI